MFPQDTCIAIWIDNKCALWVFLKTSPKNRPRVKLKLWYVIEDYMCGDMNHALQELYTTGIASSVRSCIVCMSFQYKALSTFNCGEHRFQLQLLGYLLTRMRETVAQKCLLLQVCVIAQFPCIKLFPDAVDRCLRMKTKPRLRYFLVHPM